MPLSKILWLRALARQLLGIPAASARSREPSRLDLEELEPRNAPALVAAPTLVDQHTAIVAISNQTNTGAVITLSSGGKGSAGSTATPGVANGGPAGVAQPGIKIALPTGLGMFLTTGTIAIPQPAAGTSTAAGSTSSASSGSTGGSTGSAGTTSAGSTGSASSGSTATAPAQGGPGVMPPGGVYLGTPAVIPPGLTPTTNPANPGGPTLVSSVHPQPQVSVTLFSGTSGVGKGGLFLTPGTIALQHPPTGINNGLSSSSAGTSSSASAGSTGSTSGPAATSSAGSTGSGGWGAGGVITYSGATPGVGLYLSASSIALPAFSHPGDPAQIAGLGANIAAGGSVQGDQFSVTSPVSQPAVADPITTGMPADLGTNRAAVGNVQDNQLSEPAPLAQPPVSPPTAVAVAQPAGSLEGTSPSASEIVVQQPTSDSNALLVEPNSAPGTDGGSTSAGDYHAAVSSTESVTSNAEYNPTGNGTGILVTSAVNGDNSTSPGTPDFDPSGGIVNDTGTVD